MMVPKTGIRCRIAPARSGPSAPTARVQAAGRRLHTTATETGWPKNRDNSGGRPLKRA